MADSPARRWLRKMAARDPHEAHRVATPLELLFDLCFVVAVAQAASRLHHGIAEGHFGAAALGYVLVFFAIWWAWMNFTWFASAYDTDDVPYRLKVLLQIVGVLILAAGVPAAFEHHDYRVVIVGYTTMRVALVAHWLRAARADRSHRPAALRYAVGVTLCQLGWISLLWFPRDWWLAGWIGFGIVELLVPVWAERAAPTSWHPHHIAERYGLLTLIVLGESVSAALAAIQSVVAAGAITAHAVALVVGGLLILFAMWWLYFDQPSSRPLDSVAAGFEWGYGHLVIFSSTAAVGAGLGLAADSLTGNTHISSAQAGAALSVPVAAYVLSVWLILVRPQRRGLAINAAYWAAILLIVASAGPSCTALLDGAILAVLVVVTMPRASEGHAGEGHAGH